MFLLDGCRWCDIMSCNTRFPAMCEACNQCLHLRLRSECSIQKKGFVSSSQDEFHRRVRFSPLIFFFHSQFNLFSLNACSPTVTVFDAPGKSLHFNQKKIWWQLFFHSFTMHEISSDLCKGGGRGVGSKENLIVLCFFYFPFSWFSFDTFRSRSNHVPTI